MARRLQTRLVGLALVCALAGGTAGGCKRANGRPPEGATVPSEVSTATNEVVTTTTLSYDVPAVIDEAYVERVMAALDEVQGDAIRIIGRERKITDDVLDHLTAIYTQDEFEIQVGTFLEEGRQQRFEKRSPTVGNPRTDVRKLFRATPTCVVAEVDRDFSATVTSDAVAGTKSFVALVPEVAGRDRRGLNPTPWVMAFDREFSGEPETEKWCDV